MQAENHPQYQAAFDLLTSPAATASARTSPPSTGTAGLCDQFWRNYSLGNILQTPFADIWQNEADPVLHTLRNKRKYKDPKCARCRWFDLCLGNFRSLSGRPDLADWQNEPPCYLTEEEIKF